MKLIDCFRLVDHVDHLMRGIRDSDRSINTAEIALINEQYKKLVLYAQENESPALQALRERLGSSIYTIETFHENVAKDFNQQLLSLRQGGCKEDAVVLAAERLQLPPTEAMAYVDQLK